MARKGIKKIFGGLYGAGLLTLTIASLSVSTYAWFQAEARVRIETTPASATITVSRPEGAAFYYFNGNGTPGGLDYTGYSSSSASFGNKTHMVNTSTNKLTMNGGGSYSDVMSFATSWTAIDLDDATEASKAFDFSKMRPGCYYSFCVVTTLDTSKLKLSFSLTGGSNVNGDSLSTKRRICTGADPSETSTASPLNLLMGFNAHCALSNAAGANSFLTASLANPFAGTDKIAYNRSSPATDYYMLGSSGAGTATSTNKHIFFTVFMGKPDKSDALLYRGTSGGIEYYQPDQSTGSYSALDGLKATLTSVDLS